MSGTPTGVGRAGGRAVGVRNGAGLVPGCGDEPPGLSDSWTRAAPVAAMRRRPAPKIRIGPWPSRSTSGRHLGVTRRLEAYATTAGGLFALTPTLSRSRAGFAWRESSCGRGGYARRCRLDCRRSHSPTDARSVGPAVAEIVDADGWGDSQAGSLRHDGGHRSPPFRGRVGSPLASPESVWAVRTKHYQRHEIGVSICWQTTCAASSRYPPNPGGQIHCFISCTICVH